MRGGHRRCDQRQAEQHQQQDGKDPAHGVSVAQGSAECIPAKDFEIFPARNHFSYMGWMFVLLTLAADTGSRVEYVGGTLPQFAQGSGGAIDAVDPEFCVIWTRKSNLRIPYERINLLEYGQQVSRRLAMAALISPMLILAKKKRHFLTLGYQDDDGKQQAMVFRVAKQDIRTVLVTLEARTGVKVQYQDDEARKAGKG